MDDLSAYTKDKNKACEITLVKKKTRQIVGFDVVCDKSEKRIQKIVDSALKATSTTLTRILCAQKYIMKALCF